MNISMPKNRISYRTLFLLVFSSSFLALNQYVKLSTQIGENGYEIFLLGAGGGGGVGQWGGPKRKKVHYGLLKTENKYKKRIEFIPINYL